MGLIFEDRPSPSSFVERVWRCRSDAGGPFFSMAESNVELVFTRLPGLVRATLRGPVTRAVSVECPPNGRWLAIRFSLGTYFAGLSTASLLDHSDLELPIDSRGRFWLAGGFWETPSYDDAEALVGRLARAGVVAHDETVSRAIAGEREQVSLRSMQRRFQRATGLAHARVRLIERARCAAQMLRDGSSILDVAHDAGYADQAHLTRSLTRLIGQSPRKLVEGRAQLSFSFKTPPPG